MKTIFSLLSILSLILGSAILYTYASDTTTGLPTRDQLTEIEGNVNWVSKHRYGIRFGLEGNLTRFNYPSKARELGQVRRALEKSIGDKVFVLADMSDSHSPIYNDNEYFDVFELRTDDVPVRTYEETSKAWLSDNALMPYIGSFMIFGAFFIWWNLLRKRES